MKTEPDAGRPLLFLYENAFGRIILKALIRPFSSKIAGTVLDAKISKIFIRRFVRNNAVDLTQAQDADFASFNDFFTRKLIDGARVVDMSEKAFVSPCDCLLSAYRVARNSVFDVKGVSYALDELFENQTISGEYEGGLALIFRLRPKDYHRYIYIDDGTKGKNIRIDGIFHTVNPIAHSRYKVYRTNTREYTIMKTENFGLIAQMEIGAMLVGRIVNHHDAYEFHKGEEKGYFEFGGSTIVILVKKDVLKLNPRFMIDSGKETEVHLGEKIGLKQDES